MSPTTSRKITFWALAMFLVALACVEIAALMIAPPPAEHAPSPEHAAPAQSSEATVPVQERATLAPRRRLDIMPPRAQLSSNGLILHNVTLHDQDRRTIYQGDIDLRPTLQRIAAGHRLHFSHDGITFQNREGRLPRQSPGYYQEWVVPTPGEDGPGPQRLVIGEQGDVWYTGDHYRSFRRIPHTLSPERPSTDR